MLLLQDPSFDDGLHLHFDEVQMLIRNPHTRDVGKGTRLRVEVSRPIHVPPIPRAELREVINVWRRKRSLEDVKYLEFVMSDYF